MIQRIKDWLAGKPHVGRNSGWASLSRAYLAMRPDCAVCGAEEGVVPHHIIPVHVNAAFEMDVSNLIPLCPVHHLWWGHLGNWRSWNAAVRTDAAAWLEKIKARPK